MGITLFVIILLPILLYIPPIQEFVKGIAISQVSKATGWDISIDRLLISFPLDINVDNVLVIDAARDTMMAANKLNVDVKIAPLLRLKIAINRATLINGKYQMLSADSSMLLKAKVNFCEFFDGSINIKRGEISVDDAYMKGGDVLLYFDNEKSKPTPEDTTESTPWLITARSIKIENVHYSMQMLPIIDNIDAHISSATMQDGLVNTATCEVKVRYLAMDKANASYYTASKEYLASYQPKDTIAQVEPSSNSQYWTITGDSIRLTNTTGLYAQRGAKPKPGLDLDYLQGDNINISVDNFYNRGVAIKVPVTHLSGNERCGIKIINTSGVFNMDSVSMKIINWDINTFLSHFTVDANFENDVFEKKPNAKVSVNIVANFCLGEVSKLYPSYSTILKTIPQYENGKAKVAISGTLANLNIQEISAKLPKYASLAINGNVSSINNPKKLRGEVAITGDFENINFIKPSILDAKLQKSIQFPPLSINGKASMNGSEYTAKVTMKVPTGRVALDMQVNNRSEAFDVEMKLDSFPVQAVMPLSKFGRITAYAKAYGSGFNPLNPKSAISADIVIDDFQYNNQLYKDISAFANIKDNEALFKATSHNTDCDFDLDLLSTFANSNYKFSLNSTIKELDLKSLGLSASLSEGSVAIATNGEIDMNKSIYDVSLNLSDLSWNLDDNFINTPTINTTIYSNSDTLSVSLDNIGLHAEINTSCSLDSFINLMSNASNKLAKQYRERNFDFDKTQNILPELDIKISDNGQNIVRSYLAKENIKYANFICAINNDSTIHLTSKIETLNVGNLTLDTITFLADERDESLFYDLHVGNKKGNMDGFASSTVSGSIHNNYISSLFTQKNSSEETGFKIGFIAEMSDSATRLSLFPENPIIGYRNWALNKDNYLEYHYNKHIDANLMLTTDSSYLSLNTNHENFDNQEGITLKIAGIQIAEWLTLSPFAPQIKGVIGADITMAYDGKNIWGNGNAGITNFYYNRSRIGNFDFNVDLALDPIDKYTNATASLSINNKKVMTAKGILNDSTSANPDNLKLNITNLPLNIINPFIPNNIATVKGNMNGAIDMIGSLSKPILNGYLEFDSTHISVPLFGSHLTMPKTKIPVDSSVVKFNNYSISGDNANPLTINGYCNILPLDNPFVDFSIKGSNVQFVNSKRTNHSELFGKGYANVNANVKGKLSKLDINANLDILAGTNLTYVMQTSVNSITQQNTGNIVKFVQFNDTTSFNKVDSIAIANPFTLDVKAVLNVEQGATLNVNLSPDGKNKVEINGNGSLSYTQNALGDSRFTGRYTINKGFVRYSPPLISEQLFTFEGGSYIAWNGDIMNPSLNIKANETIKTNVTLAGENSAMVNFNIQLSVTNTLDDLGLKFDLSTNDNPALYSELQAMTPDQRSNQAMNLILYKSYTGPGTESDAKIVGNPLYSFLAGQLNDWASKNLKGIDISFGISQYNRTYEGNTSLATNYSYHISKSFFNDRFKVVIGGNYDDATSDANLAESLINDLSLEYIINQSGSMYVKVFRHTGYESIFEGQVTSTGAGFVFRRKLSTLKDIFKFNLHPKATHDSIKKGKNNIK